MDYVVRSDLIYRLLCGGLTSPLEHIPALGTVLRNLNPFQLAHQHPDLSATVQGNVVRRNTVGQPVVHVDVYVVR